MKVITTALALISIIAAPLSMAGASRHSDYAKVTHVNPVYQSVKHRVPEKHCWVETVRTERHHPRSSATSTLIGGAIGGAIGHAVGHGKSNKKLGAVVGSVIGMSVGHDLGRRDHGNRTRVTHKDVERCEVQYRTETQQQLHGYDVSYRYHGKTYTTFMKKRPGKKIKVAVNVRPVSKY